MFGEGARGGLPALLQTAGEERHEGGIEGALGEQAPEQVGQAEGDEERVRHRPGPDRRRDQNIAHKTQHAADPEKFELAVRLSRITFPYLLFMALVALLGGVLNSLYKFAAAAAAPILLNVVFIGALLFVLPATGKPGYVLAWSVAAAGIGQFLLLAIAAGRAGG